MIEDGTYTLVFALLLIDAVPVLQFFCMNGEPLSELISDGMPNLGITVSCLEIELLLQLLDLLMVLPPPTC